MSREMDYVYRCISVGTGDGKEHIDTFRFGNVGTRQGLPDGQQFIRL